MKKHYHSVFYSEHDILRAIIDLHIKEAFHLDPMYFKGGFYKQMPIPFIIGDINPLYESVEKMDATNLPFNDKEIRSMILDPPFVIANRKSQMKNNATNFGYFKSFDELRSFYEKILSEAQRVLKRKGLLVFKCQDFTDNKTIMTHILVHELATKQGFYAKDLAILVNTKNKPTNNKLNQRHFRKVHTYFWVFQKE